MDYTSFPLKILVVDDDAIQMQAICDTLRDCGYAIDGFTDPLIALQSIQQNHYDLVLVDLVMPNLNGVELMKAAHKHDRDIGCLIFTALASIPSAIEALKLGAIDYVLKPFDLRVLEPALRRAAHLRQVQIDKTVATLALQANNATLVELNLRLTEAQRASEEANRLKSSFLASMSHEIRTPLNAIVGFAKILNSESLPKTEQQVKQFTSNIITSANHLLGLADEFLDLASIESGKLRLSIINVSVAAVVKECIELMKPLSHQRDIAINIGLIENYSVMADVKRFKQIVLNLLSNAIKYNRVGGMVDVSCQKIQDGMISIAVRDTGEGICAEHIHRLFQPFDRIGKDVANIPGTGLGLVMVKRLVEQMRGTIEVESVVTRGSTFTFTLPGVQY